MVCIERCGWRFVLQDVGGSYLYFGWFMSMFTRIELCEQGKLP